MTTQDWLQLAAQGGAGVLVLAGILLAVRQWLMPMIVKVVAPMIVGAFDNLAAAVRDGAAAQAAAIKEQAAAARDQAAAIGRLGERISRIEGRLDISEDAPPSPAPAGTADHVPINIARR